MRKNENDVGLPEIGQGKRGEDGYLGYLLRQAANTYDNRANRALSDLGVSSAQFSDLTILSAYPRVSGADIARIALLTPQTVSVIVANLEKRDSIERRPHPVLGRIQNLELTEIGRVLLRESRKRMHDIESDLTHGFSDDEQGVIKRWLVSTAVANSKGNDTDQ